MQGYMNAEASEARTIETGEAHYFSRSRQVLWHKGSDQRLRAANSRSCSSTTTRTVSGCASMSRAAPVAMLAIAVASIGACRPGTEFRQATPSTERSISSGPIPRRSSIPRTFTATRRTRRFCNPLDAQPRRPSLVCRRRTAAGCGSRTEISRVWYTYSIAPGKPQEIADQFDELLYREFRDAPVVVAENGLPERFVADEADEPEQNHGSCEEERQSGRRPDARERDFQPPALPECVRDNQRTGDRRRAPARDCRTRSGRKSSRSRGSGTSSASPPNGNAIGLCHV